MAKLNAEPRHLWSARYTGGMTHIAMPAPERMPIMKTVAPMKMRMVSNSTPANKTASRPRTMTYQTSVGIWLHSGHSPTKKPRLCRAGQVWEPVSRTGATGESPEA